eukprot:jgi/Phyca11/22060/fgenesh1_pg.PHYCAscaffold_558_\
MGQMNHMSHRKSEYQIWSREKQQLLHTESEERKSQQDTCEEDPVDGGMMIVRASHDDLDDVNGVMADIKNAEPTTEIIMSDVDDDAENRGHDHDELFPTRTLPTVMEAPAATVPAMTNGMSLDEATRVMK